MSKVFSLLADGLTLYYFSRLNLLSHICHKDPGLGFECINMLEEENLLFIDSFLFFQHNGIVSTSGDLQHQRILHCYSREVTIASGLSMHG
jgi:hypothetical protein